MVAWICFFLASSAAIALGTVALALYLQLRDAQKKARRDSLSLDLWYTQAIEAGRRIAELEQERDQARASQRAFRTNLQVETIWLQELGWNVRHD